MDYDSSNRFISSLAKFLQSLCNGYVEFNNGVQIIGHIYLSVDTDKIIDYVLNEKVSKTDKNSVTFISNSFHATPAEEPKPGKDSKNTTETENRSGLGGSCSTENVANPSLTSKRSHSPSSGRSSKSNKRFRNDSIDISSAVPLTVELSNDLTHRNSDDEDACSESDQPNFCDVEEIDANEKKDLKLILDSDVTFVKEELTSPKVPESGQDHDREAEEYSSNSAYPPQLFRYVACPGQPEHAAASSQRSNINPAGHTTENQSQLGGGEIANSLPDLLQTCQSSAVLHPESQLPRKKKMSANERQRRFYHRLKTGSPHKYKALLKRQSLNSQKRRERFKNFATDIEKATQREKNRQRMKTWRQKRKELATGGGRNTEITKAQRRKRNAIIFTPLTKEKTREEIEEKRKQERERKRKERDSWSLQKRILECQKAKERYYKKRRIEEPNEKGHFCNSANGTWIDMKPSTD